MNNPHRAVEDDVIGGRIEGRELIRLAAPGLAPAVLDMVDEVIE